MKRASFTLIILSLVLVLGCENKAREATAVTDCYTAMPGTRPVEITVKCDPAATPPRYEITGINPEAVYLSLKATNKVRWTIVNEMASLPVTVTVESFVNEVNSADRDPFGSTHDQNIFSVSNVAPGQSGVTAPSAPLNGKMGNFKYKVTVTFLNGPRTTQIVLDPRVVVGD